MKTKVHAMEQELATAQAHQRQEKEDYASKQEIWAIQEARYKAEIKRLEVLIHQTSDKGLEAVALARSNTLLRGGRRYQHGDSVDSKG